MTRTGLISSHNNQLWIVVPPYLHHLNPLCQVNEMGVQYIERERNVPTGKKFKWKSELNNHVVE